MRNHRPLGLLSLLVALLWSGCDSSQPAVETRWRFVGGDTIALQTNAPALRETLALRESAALRGPLLTNATRLLWRLAAGTTNAPADALAAAQPLVADLLDRLSLGETLLPEPNRREFALVLSGDPARAEVWRTAWPKFFNAVQSARGGKPGKPQALFQSGWIVAVSDAGLIEPRDALKVLAQISAAPQVVLQAETKIAGWPAATLTAAVRDGAVRSQLKLTFAESLPAELPAWKVPPFVKDPLVQFGAARGVGPWLSRVPLVGALLKELPPSQLFMWSYGGASLQSYLATIEADPEKFISRANDELAGKFKPNGLMGGAEYKAGQGVFAITGLPSFVMPVLAALHTNDTGYVTFRAYPSRPSTNPPPAELLAQIRRDNLLAYDWEITPAMIPHWNAFFQLGQIIQRYPVNDRTPAQLWLAAVAPKLDNSVTEALVTGGHELTVSRKSSVGLSALEVTGLAWWLDNAPAPTPKRTAATRGKAPAKPAARAPASHP